MPVGETIRRLRNQRGMSLEALAAECQRLGLDVSKTDISRYERGRLIDAERVLPIIAKALHIESPNDLGDWDEWFRAGGRRWGKRPPDGND